MFSIKGFGIKPACNAMLSIAGRFLLYSLLVTAVLLAADNVYCGGVEVRVVADSVNIRSRPDENSEIVGQASSGDILISEKGLTGDWVEILPPSGVNFWAHRDLIKDGEAVAPKVQVRVGPGISYRYVGIAEKGQKVKVLGQYGDWLKIGSTPSCRLWISAKYVKPVSEPARNAAHSNSGGSVEGKKSINAGGIQQASASGNLTKPIVASKPVIVAGKQKEGGTAPRAEIAKVESGRRTDAGKLTQSEEQGVSVKHEGVIRPSGFVWRRPSKYRLVRYDENGHAITICYVSGDNSQLASLAGHYVVIEGRENWVQGVRYPVVDIKQIIRRN